MLLLDIEIDADIQIYSDIRKYDMDKNECYVHIKRVLSSEPYNYDEDIADEIFELLKEK